MGLILSCAVCAIAALGPGARTTLNAPTHGIAPSINFPPIITTPLDGGYTEGQTGFVISWSIDGQGTTSQTYTISRNGTQVASGSWNDPGTITYPVNGLAAGVYSFLLHASDNVGFVEDEVIVTVHEAPPTPANIDWVIWTVVIAFAGVAALIVFKAVKVLHLRG
jgi:hypothetical protein